MFCGEQRSGKSTSKLWFTQLLVKKYRKKRIFYIDPVTEKIKRFEKPPKLSLYSNMGIGKPIDKKTIYDVIDSFDPYANEIRFVLIDEIQSYFPKDGSDKDTKAIKDTLVGLFSQLGKRNVYLMSTAQVYGRLDKSLREQCLYMFNCYKSFTGYLVNEKIPGGKIVCDELGRWSGDPVRIYRHGLPKDTKYDTKKLIRT
jgi:hypothetical protein